MKRLFYINRSELQHIEQKVLALCIGKKYFSFAITSFPGNELYSIGYFTNGSVNETFLSTLFSEYEVLNNSFFQTLVIFDYPESILIPSHFPENSSGSLLETIHGNLSESEIISDSLEDWQLNNAYAIPKSIFNRVKSKFSSINYMHVYSAILKFYNKSFQPVINNGSDGYFLIDFKSEEFSIVALKGKKILLAQCYSYVASGDVVYQLLKICRHFSFSQNNTRLLISGLIDPGSALFHEISQFFQHVDFRNATDWSEIISAEKECQPHYFASLNDLAKCVS